VSFFYLSALGVFFIQILFFLVLKIRVISVKMIIFVVINIKSENMSEKKIKTALVSVFHKDGLDALLAKLHAEGVKFLSTGGTQKFIEELGYPCQAVEEVTTYPSILGGRVKTLHPKIFGGILGRRELESDRNQMAQYEIPEIDLVIVDLYPFEDTVASGASEADIIEKIDIGGISLIRAGAKNFKDVVIVPSKAEYEPLLKLIEKNGAQTTLEERRWFATRAFGVSSHYDTAIHAYFAEK
jgi:phosphoribosylaminoimidazolecarboxamide formyltransferase/IMP cyclohydrolase